MLDENWTPVNFAAINCRIMPRLPSLLPQWLPNGEWRGNEWCALNPTRDDRRLGSFLINRVTGFWGDFATGDTGGDPISLYAYIRGLKQPEAARDLQCMLGGW
ncbi:hypothetical protein [Ruegeria jejuensis]|uniref:hypothetical protein n=1 Tax=Ruegeria jejuensis TaxID=3233338 RepID=UPI00355C2145